MWYANDKRKKEKVHGVAGGAGCNAGVEYGASCKANYLLNEWMKKL